MKIKYLGMDSIFIEKILDRIYRIFKIFVFPFSRRKGKYTIAFGEKISALVNQNMVFAYSQLIEIFRFIKIIIEANRKRTYAP